jgi:hypothetical protein
MDEQTEPQDPEVAKLQAAIDAAAKEQRYEDCAALRDQLDHYLYQRDTKEALREVSLEQILNELKRRTIAGTIAVQYVGQDNKCRTFFHNYGDCPSISACRNMVYWSAGHEIRKRTAEMFKQHFPPEGWEDEPSGPVPGAFL